MDKEDKIDMALSSICSTLYDGLVNDLGIDEYNCNLVDCQTCLFNDHETFSEFMMKYRHDKNYGNGDDDE
jgi:hypothetical protein